MAWRLFAGMIGAELAVSLVQRRWTRQRLWKAAKERARATGKPLLVLGAPGNGIVNFFFTDYGCGDLCVDLQGCPECPASIRGPAEVVLAQVTTPSVVFVSCTLEYVTDPNLVMGHLRRIAGPDVFVATVEPTSLTSWLYPGARWKILHAPEGTDAPLVYAPVWGRRR